MASLHLTTKSTFKLENEETDNKHPMLHHHPKQSKKCNSVRHEQASKHLDCVCVCVCAAAAAVQISRTETSPNEDGAQSHMN